MNPSLLCAAFTFAAFCYVLLPLGRLTVGWRLAVFAALFGLSFAPHNGVALAGYLRGLFGGELAIPTLVFLVWSCLRQTFAWPLADSTQRILPLVFFAALGLVLFPATLGLSSLDPYRFGFEPGLLLLVSAAGALAFCFVGNCVASLALVLTGVAFMLGIKNSQNYWDYLIDPLMALYSLGAVLLWLGGEVWAWLTAARKPVLVASEA